METFKKEEIHLLSYHDGFKRKEHYYVCIKSLLQLEHLKSEEFGQYVVKKKKTLVKTLFSMERGALLAFYHGEVSSRSMIGKLNLIFC